MEHREDKSILYKELFEQAFEYDIKSFLKLIDCIENKSDEWQEASLEIIPDFANIVNELFMIADEIVLRRPELDHKNKVDYKFSSAFNNSKAKELLQKTIEHGFCNNEYKWLKTKALLAYFADRASEYLNLGKGEYDGKPKTSWKPFETLFGISGLSGAKRDYQKTGIFPDGHADVDRLFE